MQYRRFGATGWKVSEVSFGAWAIGGSWGPVDDEASYAALARAVERGVNLIDTADVYGDGRSERLVGRLLAARKNASTPLYVATKAGRRLAPHTAEGYTAANLEAFIHRSRKNLGVDALDLLQLHCPPTEVYHRPAVFEALDSFVARGLILHYGVSVETVDEALHAVKTYPGVRSVQVIFNAFRHKPAEKLFALCAEKDVAILARVPLASGLLTGKLRADTVFASDDHRAFNRHGEAFDQGETFSGVDYARGLEAVEALRPLVPAGATMAQFALRWLLMFPEVSCAIPGARSVAQVDENVAASELAPLDSATMATVRAVYDRYFRERVHPRW